jgi:hypothetical protein
MGVFRNYLASNMSMQAVETERRAQLKRIGEIRNSAVISYAARTTFAPIPLPTAILYDDLLPFRDTLEGLTGPRAS